MQNCILAISRPPNTYLVLMHCLTFLNLQAAGDCIGLVKILRELLSQLSSCLLGCFFFIFLIFFQI